jgi:hypothetical protein
LCLRSTQRKGGPSEIWHPLPARRRRRPGCPRARQAFWGGSREVGPPNPEGAAGLDGQPRARGPRASTWSIGCPCPARPRLPCPRHGRCPRIAPPRTRSAGRRPQDVLRDAPGPREAGEFQSGSRRAASCRPGPSGPSPARSYGGTVGLPAASGGDARKHVSRT